MKSRGLWRESRPVIAKTVAKYENLGNEGSRCYLDNNALKLIKGSLVFHIAIYCPLLAELETQNSALLDCGFGIQRN
jgi:hypothetical protein